MFHKCVENSKSKENEKNAGVQVVPPVNEEYISRICLAAVVRNNSWVVIEPSMFSVVP